METCFEYNKKDLQQRVLKTLEGLAVRGASDDILRVQSNLKGILGAIQESVGENKVYNILETYSRVCATFVEFGKLESDVQLAGKDIRDQLFTILVTESLLDILKSVTVEVED